MIQRFRLLSKIVSTNYYRGKGFVLSNNNPILDQRFVVRSSSSLFRSATTTTTSAAAAEDVSDDDDSHGDDNSLRNQQYLIDRFGCTKEKIKRELGPLSKVNIGILQERIDWLQNRLILNDDEMKKLIQKALFLLKYHSLENLEPTVAFLEERLFPTTTAAENNNNNNNNEDDHESSISSSSSSNHEKLVRLVQRAPYILCLSIEGNLEPTIRLLEDELELHHTKGALGRLIVRSPTIVQKNLKDTLTLKLNFLQNRLGFESKSQAVDVIVKNPAILNMSLEKKIAPALDEIQDRLELTNDADLGRLISKVPNIISRSDSGKEQMDWLEKRLYLEDTEELATCILKFPTLLGLNIQTNLEPTLEFFLESLRHEDDDEDDEYYTHAVMVDFLKKDPRIFSASIEKRLRPRLEEVKQLGLPIDLQTIAKMAKCTPDQWKKSLDFQSSKMKKRAESGLN